MIGKLYFAVLFLALSVSAFAQEKEATYKAPFPYVIVHNEIDPPVNSTDSERRFVEVLMSPKTFTDKNLITLTNLVLKRFPTPTLLYLRVFSRLGDIETPEEREEGRTTSRHPVGANPGPTATIVRLVSGQRRLTVTVDGHQREVRVK